MEDTVDASASHSPDGSRSSPTRVGASASVLRSPCRLARDGFDLWLHSWPPQDAERPWGADPALEELFAELRGGGVAVEHASADLPMQRLQHDSSRQPREYSGLSTCWSQTGLPESLEELSAVEHDLSLRR